MASVTVWYQPDSPHFPDARFAWLLRGPKGGVVLCPNRVGGWEAKQWQDGIALPPEESAEPAWIAKTVCWVLAVPGAEKPTPVDLEAVRLQQTAELIASRRSESQARYYARPEVVEIAEHRREREQRGGEACRSRVLPTGG